MSLSRKHYEAVALELRETRAKFEDWSYVATERAGAASALSHLEDRLCVYFRSDNPAFNPDRFREAAQP